MAVLAMAYLNFRAAVMETDALLEKCVSLACANSARLLYALKLAGHATIISAERPSRFLQWFV